MKNKFEKLTAEEEKDKLNYQQFAFKKPGKRSGPMRLWIMIGIVITVVSLSVLLLAKVRRLSAAKALHSELTAGLEKLKEQELELQKRYDELNKEKEEVARRNEVLNKDLSDYKSKNDKLMKDNNNINEEINKLEKELQAADEEGKNLNAINAEALKKLNELQEESKRYDKEIEDLKSQIKELESQSQSIPDFDSKIVTKREERDYLKRLFPYMNLQLRRIFTKSEYGLSPEKFHKQCDEIGKTLVLLNIRYETSSIKIGGFTSKSWSAPIEFTYKPDQTAFIFNLSSKTQYTIKAPEKAIICDTKYLAAFNYDLLIDKDGLQSYFPNAYNYDEVAQPQLLAGLKHISEQNIIEMEVFEVIGSE